MTPNASPYHPAGFPSRLDRLAALVLVAAVACAASPALAGELVLPEPDSAAYQHALAVGGALAVHKDTAISGDVRVNGSIHSTRA